MKKLLKISLDPGFDGCKVILGGEAYNVPFIAEETTGRNSFTSAVNDSFLQYEKDGKSYIVGEVAKLATMESNHVQASAVEMDKFYSIEPRFQSDLFPVITDSAIGYALICYDAADNDFHLKELDNYDIQLVVTLPHKLQAKLWGYIKDGFTAEHHYNLAVGANNPVSFHYEIKKENAFYQSQTICVLYNEFLDDNGNMKKDATNELPALVIDGGYKTVGEVQLSRTLSVDNDDSNTDYAMLNINELVAAKVKELTSRPIQSYTVAEYARRGEKLRYMDGDDVKFVDIEKMQKETIASMEADYMKHLLTKFDNLLSINSIYIAGGTGATYYNYIKKFCSEKRAYLADKVILSEPVLNGKKLSPVFAIAAGAYKKLLSL